jgi:S-disulfanyl-L-cysteine oxidoreductase SoxD
MEINWPASEVHRAMPNTQPGTLNPNEVYALTAYILALNGIISDTTVLNERSLPAVRMPNRDGFIADSRPDTKGSQPRQTRGRR